MSFGSNNSANKFKKTYVKDWLDTDGTIIARNSLQSNNLISISGPINIGDSNTTNVFLKNLNVKNNIITINKDGDSISNAGIEIEENGIIQSSIKLSNDKTNFNIKYPYDATYYNLITQKNLHDNINNIDEAMFLTIGVNNNSIISGNCMVGGTLSVSNIICNNFQCDNLKQISAYITLVDKTQIPLYKSINDTTLIYKNLNLNNLLINSNHNTIFIYPYFSIKFYDESNNIINHFNNNNDDIYFDIFKNLNVKKINIYYKSKLII